MNFLKQSIITRLGTAMFAISLMALISMISSVIVAESTQGDAAGINLAGSLRMMSYRIIAETQQHAGEGSQISRDKVLASIGEFDRRINDPILTNVLPKDSQQQLRQAYSALIDEWRHNFEPSLKAAILTDQPDRSAYLRQLENFVPRIDQMVHLLEESTESKIKLLSLIQGISLFMTVMIIFIAMYDIKSNVVEPLAQLLNVARDAGQGKLDTRVHYRSDDELGLLGTTFNHMAEELSRTYADLESRVQRKTAELRESNKSLQLLYNATRRFNRDEDICRRLMPVMKELEDVLAVGPIEVTLCDPHQRSSYRQLTTQLLERPTDCRNTRCSDCIVPELDKRQHDSVTLPIQTREAYFGEFKVNFLPKQPLGEEQVALLRTLVENLAIVLSLELKASQEQHMSLMEERAVIARELHDSLAQSLSYLKMQVGRLQILRKQKRDDEQIDEVVGELKEGLNNAYRQLRELLTTFRLTLDQPGLQPALESTVKEFSERLGYDIPLKYNLHHQSLTANEEIHVLQLVREALANVVKHSGASEVSVQVIRAGERVEVRVEDNGVGLPPSLDSQGHYGLLIMRDRTLTLNGDLSVDNREPSGTRVLMTFKPKQS
ncbi:type IV pili methyl-accepting chemotaxis transducer N-terminal domain-containing protein [Marinobacterium sp. D7]|uniref:type IV pili methyl-accepting chemotaxis transducer N-terminal domain-containing protein n=1 Tax=Marinobacterium ramblicola TaxID=2849041 RepID=UPI001C2CF1A6|nr:type IV pili methyl-accepting chemotaxis transducer N-terminal domain-containing protein [Marinobacterium ramblicola]MBV1787519.1 type IV pili methyl-accepting chemotaxis transducer N-terminal domain-containing protein [Marinobacterium ramblicola]